MKRWAAFGLLPGAALALIAAAYLLAGPAAAEQTGNLEVRVAFDGKISPHVLPRLRPAPVSLELNGAIYGNAGAPPPQLQRIELAFGARGGLDIRGLPVCPRGRLENATHRQSLDRCRSALVGHGALSAEVPLNPVDPVIAHAQLLAFNGRSHGRPAVWVHAYSASPPVSFVLPFYLRRQATGSYGILMRAPVRRALGRWPRLRSFDITLGRGYRGGGESRSYLNARCPLPPKFTALSVPIARATYYFAPRPILVQPILRRCRVIG